MNKLKTLKYYPNTENGFFEKLSRQCSTVRAKLKRKTSRNKNSIAIQSDRYDVSGSTYEISKLDIGDPILISKTSIDSNTYNPSPPKSQKFINTSSESETDIYMDAISSFPSSIDPSPIKNDINNELLEILNENNDEILTNCKSSKLYERKRSKSAQNLHKSELKIFLQKVPSLDIKQKLENDNNQISENDIKNESNTSINIDNLNLIENNNYSSDSLNKMTSSSFNNLKFNQNEILTKNEINNDDIDLKSISYQNLNAHNIFLSIDQLNKITQEINETEKFDTDIDYEYCEHRENLKPNERRIALLKNKNTHLIDIKYKKEKINYAWNGLKQWLGEESERLKEMMQKHAAMQKVGGVICKTPINLTILNEEKNFNSNIKNDIYKINSNELMEIGYDMSVNQVNLNESSISVLSESNNDITQFSQKNKLKENWEGQNGFEELRRYIKQGGDFGKDLVTILQERVESELLYSKSLAKMATKLNKACREVPGTVTEAWRSVANELEGRSELHRNFSNSLTEEIVKPLKTLIESQHKTRKSIESNVDKTARTLNEWRTSEAKAKKSSHIAARENEKLQDAMLDVRIQKSPSLGILQHTNKINNDKELKIAEKDSAKLDNKRRKAEDAVKKADVEYYTLCIKAERSRVDWEMSVLCGSLVLQNIESQRLMNMKNFAISYLKMTSEMNPILYKLIDKLKPQIDGCNIPKDLIIVKNIRKATEGPSEQLLPDFYCEHTTLAMNRERRKHSLIKLLQLVRMDLERERRSRHGLKELSQSLNDENNQSIIDKLYHIRSMLTYLEGARFKLQSALLELDHKPRNQHPLAPHIHITRDRTGLQQSVLKVPLWLKHDAKMNKDDFESDINVIGSCTDIKNEILISQLNKDYNRSRSTLEINLKKPNLYPKDKLNTIQTKLTNSPNFDRGIADGGSNQPDSDFDEFSSQDDDDNSSKLDKTDSSAISVTKKPAIVLSKCKALYSYTPKLYDELELSPGDVIEVHVKQDDGWWLGELDNRVGIFPATYVEEIF